MLVAQRAGAYLHGQWSYIAGHIDAGETGWQAALRELHEETDLVAEAFYTTGFCERFYSADTDCVELVPAFVARVNDRAEVHLNSEHSTFRWVALEQGAELLPFGSQRELIAHVQREFVEREPSVFLRVGD